MLFDAHRTKDVDQAVSVVQLRSMRLGHPALTKCQPDVNGGWSSLGLGCQSHLMRERRRIFVGRAAARPPCFVFVSRDGAVESEVGSRVRGCCAGSAPHSHPCS